MAAETAYRKDQFTATFLPAMALKVLNRAEVNAAKKGCRKDRDYKFTGSSQRSKDDGFPMWFRANVCKGKFVETTLIGKWSLSLGRVEGGVWPDEADLLVLVRTLFTCATKLVREKPPLLEHLKKVMKKTGDWSLSRVLEEDVNVGAANTQGGAGRSRAALLAPPLAASLLRCFAVSLFRCLGCLGPGQVDSGVPGKSWGRFWGSCWNHKVDLGVLFICQNLVLYYSSI